MDTGGGGLQVDLWTVQADGTGLTNLTSTRTISEWDPAVSPDGKRIAFASDSAPRGLWLMNADGTARTPLQAVGVAHEAPAWSPDGTQLAFESLEPAENWGIWIMNADGSNPRVVAPGGDGGQLPTWSPDGRQIAYSTVSCQLWIVNGDGSNRHATRNGTCGQDTALYAASWSPQARIAVSVGTFGSPGTIRIFTMRSDGTDLQRVTAGSWDSAPTWSPDGRRIAYVASNGNLFVINADGSVSKQLTTNGALRHIGW